MAQLVGQSPCQGEGSPVVLATRHAFHVPGLQVQSPPGARAGDNPMMLLSHTDVSFSLPPSPSNPPKKENTALVTPHNYLLFGQKAEIGEFT